MSRLDLEPERSSRLGFGVRLTIINQFFAPDLAPTGQLAAQLAEHRAALGDEVTVVTGSGGYVGARSPGRQTQRAGLRIRRIWTPGLGKANFLTRVADYGAFYLLATLRVLLLPRQDLLLSLTTPPFIALAAALYKLLHPHTKVVLWSMDCYPEMLERTGIIRPAGWISRMMRNLNRWLFQHLDGLVCPDPAMKSLLTGQYPSAHLGEFAAVIPNWEPGETFLPTAHGKPWRPPELEGRFVVLYMGNAGMGHDFESVLSAAERLRDEPIAFAFVGGGTKWDWLQEQRSVRSLSNLHLYPYVPETLRLPVLATGDCGLITLKDEALGVISPSKLHAYLAMGLPVLYIGPPGSNVDLAIERYECGLSLRHGDVDGVVSFLRGLRQDRSNRDSLGERARRAFETAFHDGVALPAFDKLLEGVLEASP